MAAHHWPALLVYDEHLDRVAWDAVGVQALGEVLRHVSGWGPREVVPFEIEVLVAETFGA